MSAALLLAMLLATGAAAQAGAPPAGPAAAQTDAPGDVQTDAAGDVQTGGPGAAQDGAPATEADDLAAAFDVVARGPRESVLLGDWFEVSIAVRGPCDDVELALAAEAFPDGVRLGEPRTVPEDGELRVALPVNVVREGTVSLDGLALRPLRRSADGALLPLDVAPLPVPPVDVQVVLGLAPNEVPRVADPLPPPVVPLGRQDVRPYAALALLLVALLVYTVLSTRTVVVVTPPRPPDLVAAEALARLRSHLPRSSAQIEAFVVEVSDVLRTYIGARFGVDAPDLTTEEFMARAGGHPALAAHRGDLEPFLALCDLVKFARHLPGLEQARGLLATAEAFVEATRERERDDGGARDDAAARGGGAGGGPDGGAGGGPSGGAGGGPDGGPGSGPGDDAGRGATAGGHAGTAGAPRATSGDARASSGAPLAGTGARP